MFPPNLLLCAHEYVLCAMIFLFFPCSRFCDVLLVCLNHLLFCWLGAWLTCCAMFCGGGVVGAFYLIWLATRAIARGTDGQEGRFGRVVARASMGPVWQVDWIDGHGGTDFLDLLFWLKPYGFIVPVSPSPARSAAMAHAHGQRITLLITK